MSGRNIAPCPECGRTHIHAAEWYDDDGGSSYYCVCDDCGYEDPDRFEEEEVAYDHWNRRLTKGYLIDDPTDTEYDKLDESDWIVELDPAYDDIDPINWLPKKQKKRHFQPVPDPLEDANEE